MAEPVSKDLITTRPDKLVEGRERTPLVEIKAKLDSWNVGQPDQYGRTYVELNFTEVEVLQSREPYHFPVAQLWLKYSDRANSAWGMFLKSMTGFAEDFLTLPGLRLHLLKHMHDYGEDQDGNRMLGEVWELKGIEGTPTERVSAEEQALRLLDGKTEPEWNQSVFKDNIVKADASIVTQIVNKTFLLAMIAQGKVTKDEAGILHRAGLPPI